MKYFISDLIVGMKHFAEFADWIESNEDPDLGIEFTAFTHDEAYWQALESKVPQMTCPLPFHGPYVNIEAASDIGSEGNVWLMESYKMMAKQIMHWAGKYTEDADIVIEYEPHEKLTHTELLDEMHELRSWVEEGKALS